MNTDYGKWALALAMSFSALACGTQDISTESTASPLVSEDGRYIVQFKGRMDRAAVEEHGPILMALERQNALVAKLPEQALIGLAKRPGILLVEPDARRMPLAQTVPYGIPMVQADQVSDSGASNRTVCIIDSGYSLGHEDLSSGSNVTGTSDPGGTGNWFEDGDGHGTHVAGTVSALNNGVGVVGVLPNGNIRLHIVRVFGNDGVWAYTSTLVNALNVCESNGANVVSMSLGGAQKSNFEKNAFNAANGRGVLSIAAAGNDGNTRHSYPASYSSVVSVAAIDENMVVASFSQQTNQVELAAPGVGVRSTVPMGSGSQTTLTVGGNGVSATAMDGSPFSSATGPLVDCGLGEAPCSGASGAVCLIQRGNISFSDKVLNCQAGGGVAAVIYNNEPGPLLGTLGGVSTSIPSAGISDTDGAALGGSLGASTTLSVQADNYAFFDGTSMATPHVSGVAALVWSHNPAWTNDQIRTALQSTALDLGAAGRDNAYGFGLVQAKAALDQLQGGGCQTTEPTEVSCSDGVDNDCDGLIDSADPDCQTQCLPRGSSCSSNGDCCSNRCKTRRGVSTCR